MRKILFVFIAIFSVQIWAQNSEALRQLAGIYKLPQSSHKLKEGCDLTLEIKSSGRYEFKYDQDECLDADRAMFMFRNDVYGLLQLGFDSERFKMLQLGKHTFALYRYQEGAVITVFDIIYSFNRSVPNDGLADYDEQINSSDYDTKFYDITLRKVE